MSTVKTESVVANEPKAVTSLFSEETNVSGGTKKSVSPRKTHAASDNDKQRTNLEEGNPALDEGSPSPGTTKVTGSWLPSRVKQPGQELAVVEVVMCGNSQPKEVTASPHRSKFTEEMDVSTIHTHTKSLSDKSSEEDHKEPVEVKSETEVQEVSSASDTSPVPVTVVPPTHTSAVSLVSAPEVSSGLGLDNETYSGSVITTDTKFEPDDFPTGSKSFEITVAKPEDGAAVDIVFPQVCDKEEMAPGQSSPLSPSVSGDSGGGKEDKVILEWDSIQYIMSRSDGTILTPTSQGNLLTSGKVEASGARVSTSEGEEASAESEEGMVLVESDEEEETGSPFDEEACVVLEDSGDDVVLKEEQGMDDHVPSAAGKRDTKKNEVCNRYPVLFK